jgi:hypothetical protein
MVVLAQLVRASVCGTEGRGFEPHIPPCMRKAAFLGCFFAFQASADTARTQGRHQLDPIRKDIRH